MKKLIKFFDNNILFYIVALLVVFIPVYPKLPAIDIKNTWVSIRVEDFLIAGAAFIFLIQFLRKKAKIYLPLSIPIGLYWVAGFLSLVICLVFVAPHLANFFPNVAILSYFRRIEYMVLFFIGFAAIKQEKDLKRIFWVLVAACVVILIYGLGQRYYIQVWSAFPDFFRNFAYCFPSFQTTNEEFAKGIPLCLPADGRVTSLFGGHYDLSAYLVMVIPVLFAMTFVLKKIWQKVLVGALGIGLIYLLALTASRISFAAYLVAAILALCFIKKKLFIIPVLIISLYILATSSSGVLQRFAQTLRFTNLVINDQGQVIGEALNKLPEDLKNRISKEPIIVDAPPPTQELPTGTSYISLPGQQTSTSSALLRSNPNLSQAQKDRYKFGAVEISAVTGNFLVQRALVYDISFTTRFQGEWPVSWAAFQRDPIFGSGYGTITLSSDNSFLRFLGETGLFGILSFFSFFLVWYIFLRNSYKHASPVTRNFVFGLSAGIIGISINALMIDVFEASKVAESMWLLLGIGAGGIILTQKEKIKYFSEIKRVLSSHLFLMTYLLILFFVYLASSFDNYFVADDFTWARWAAQSDPQKLLLNFVDAGGFFLRPIDKLVIFAEYTLFSLKSLPYHIFNLFFNFSASVAAYYLLHSIFKKKRIAFLGALLFSFIPSHSQNLFWIATISTTLSTSFILFGLLSFYHARLKNSWFLYVLSFVFFLTSVFTYENAIVFIGLVALFDVFFITKKQRKNKFITVFPYVVNLAIIGLYLGIRSQANAAGFSGDYNYNLLKVIPNAIGNYVGYLALFFTSENSLAFYNAARTSLKTYFILLSVVGFLIVAFVGGFLIEHKEKLRFSHMVKIFVFGFLFSVVALLPFLPLGNITLRYVYLGSFGMIIMLLVVIDKLISLVAEKKQMNFYAYAVVAAIAGVLCYIGLQNAEASWEKASKISYFALAHFKLDYELKKKTDIFFYNIPTKTGEAYIFPVGLVDAMYFVDNDPSIKTYIVKDYAQAKVLQKDSIAKERNTYIFTFDKNNALRRVKE